MQTGSCRFPDEPVAEIVQCGEPLSTGNLLPCFTLEQRRRFREPCAEFVTPAFDAVYRKFI